MTSKAIDGILQLIATVCPGGDAEDLVEFLEGEGLGLGEEEQDEDPSDEAPGGVPGEGALGFEGGLQARPGEGEDEVETPGRGRGEGHADFANVQREGFGAVGEGHGAHARRVEDFEEVQARRHHGDFLGHVCEPEGEARPEEEDGEEGKGHEEEVATAEGVDRQEGRERKDPIQDAGAHRREQGR